MNQIAAFYDAIALKYAGEWRDNNSLDPAYQAFTARLPDRPKVLDLCCGAGHGSARLHTLGAEVTGVDISSGAAALARKAYPECDFHVADVVKGLTGLGRFQGISAVACFHHFSPGQLAGILQHMEAVLVPGGLVLVITATGQDTCRESCQKTEAGTFTFPIYLHSKATLDCLFQAAGFCYKEGAALPEEHSRRGYRACFYEKRLYSEY